MENIQSGYISKKARPFLLGQVVASVSGRDHGNYYLVTGFKDRFLLLADGRKRGLSHPKLKNPMHVQIHGEIAADFAINLQAGTARDEQIRQVIRDYQTKIGLQFDSESCQEKAAGNPADRDGESIKEVKG